VGNPGQFRSACFTLSLTGLEDTDSRGAEVRSRLQESFFAPGSDLPEGVPDRKTSAFSPLP